MQDNQTLISVVMSVYDEPVIYVDQAIQSILDQTFTDFEFIIILDKPDYSEMHDFLESKSMQDKRIIIINNNENIGLAASLNRGISLSKGNYIARMDADDISKSNRLSQELEYIQSNNYDMVCCLADKIDEKGEIWDTIATSSSSEKYIREILPVQNIIVHPTILMKKCVFENLKGYRLFSSCQDYDLWLRMLTEGYSIGILNKNLFCFRRHKNSISSSKHYIQILNEKYIRKLYKRRVRGQKKDGFSLENLKRYLHFHGADNKKRVNFERCCFEEYQKSLRLIKSRQLLRGFCLALVSAWAYTVRESIKTSIKARRIKRKYNNLIYRSK